MKFNYGYLFEVIIRLLAAAICGGIIGFERESKNKNVGIRTYMTVCLSTALVMIIAKFCFRDTNSGDVTRMAAAAIQGISFLGAGLIINKGGHLEGMTTAAILWGTAIIGLALGYGLYIAGILATLFMVLIGNVFVKFLPSHYRNKGESK